MMTTLEEAERQPDWTLGARWLDQPILERRELRVGTYWYGIGIERDQETWQVPDISVTSTFHRTHPVPGPIDIVWVGSPNCGSRAGWAPRYLVIHTMDGTLAGCDSWFNNPDAQVSAHYGVSLAGEVHQYVDLALSAWANGILEGGNTWPGPSCNPNYVTVSIETEDNGDPWNVPVSDAEYQATLDVCATVLQQYPGITGLMTHTCISPQSRSGCPGDRWIESGKFQELADTLALQTYY